MAAFTMRIAEDDLRLIQNYAASCGQSVSGFIRDTVLDRIEDDLKIDERLILDAWECSKNDKGITLDELEKELGLQ